MHIAVGLRDNGSGMLCAFDLWYDEPMSLVAARFAGLGLLNDWVTLDRAEACHVPPVLLQSPDLVHIDIGNSGRTYLWAAKAFGDLLSPDGILLLEGGTAERDNLDWMARDNCMPIRDALRQLASDWHIFTFQAFPGLTMMRRRQ